jgi:hypothetical protein
LAPYYHFIPYFPPDESLSPYRTAWLRAKAEIKVRPRWDEEITEGVKYLRESESEAVRALVIEHIRSVLIARRNEMCDLQGVRDDDQKEKGHEVLSTLLCSLLTMLRGASPLLQSGILHCLGEIGVVDIGRYATGSSPVIKPSEVFILNISSHFWSFNLKSFCRILSV